jgi:hypothetical protein
MAGTSTQARRPSPATFWPFSVRAAILITPVLLAVFLILLGIVRATAHWPDRRLDGWLLLGIVVLSLVPLFLVLLGSVAGQGGSIEAFGVKFQWVEKVGITDITISPTLGLQPHAFLNDSAGEILSTLRQATNYSAAVVDLGEGQEWLETRLLVLSAGAAQSGRPAAIVFVATVGGVRQAFQGWAPPLEIVRGLVTANPNFASAYENAMTTAKQWELAFPSLKALSLGAVTNSITIQTPLFMISVAMSLLLQISSQVRLANRATSQIILVSYVSIPCSRRSFERRVSTNPSRATRGS